MKTIKNFIPVLLTVLILLLVNQNLFAQEELDEKPFPVGGIKEIAKKVIYPDEAKKEGIQGKVILNAIVDVKGNVIKTKIIESVGYGCDKAAVDAVTKTKFTPGKKDGKPVQAEVTIPVKFKLK